MRIIAGKFGGRAIITPRGDAARPAMARAREAIFSMLESRGLNYDGLRVLDLYAGSGSLAFEALSRGASRATLVDNCAACGQAVHDTAADLGMSARFIKMDVCRFLRREANSPFGLVFVDPPYGRGLAAKTIAALQGWLAPRAFVVAETEKNLLIDPPFLTLVRDRLFGQTYVRIWTATATETSVEI